MNEPRVSFPGDSSRPEGITDCPVCHLIFHTARVPGGLCPRCLLEGEPEEPSRRPVLIPLPPLDELKTWFPGYEVEGLLGQGGMGAVYRARHLTLERPVAIKVLLIDTESDPLFEERFRREARIMAKLDHPNIVSIHDFGRTPGGLCFLIMELVDGVDMARLIRLKEITVPAAMALVNRICDALQHAHGHGFVHRDIKPSNILLGTEGQVKIADFGLAKLLRGNAEREPLTLSGTALGTPYYIAPEQLNRQGAVDHRADLFSLGVMFYELLTGELPKGVFIPPSRKTAMDGRLDAIVLRAMNEKPDDRYQQASEIRRDVTEVQAGGRSSTESRRLQWSRRMVTWVGVVAVVILTLLMMRVGKDPLNQVTQKSGPSSPLTAVPATPFRARVPVPPIPSSRQRVDQETRIRRALEQLLADNPGMDPSQVRLDAHEEGWQVSVGGKEVYTAPAPPVPLRGIAALRDLPLDFVRLINTGVTDLSPLSNVPLRHLWLIRTPVTDLEPLRGLPLEELLLRDTPCRDVTPVATERINFMDLTGSRVTDLSQLRACSKMTVLWINGTEISDLSPIRTLPLAMLRMDSCRVRSLEPLRHVPLMEFRCRGNGLLDFTPLLDQKNLRTVEIDDGDFTGEEFRARFGKTSGPASPGAGSK